MRQWGGQGTVQVVAFIAAPAHDVDSGAWLRLYDALRNYVAAFATDIRGWVLPTKPLVEPPHAPSVQLGRIRSALMHDRAPYVILVGDITKRNSAWTGVYSPALAPIEARLFVNDVVRALWIRLDRDYYCGSMLTESHTDRLVRTVLSASEELSAQVGFLGTTVSQRDRPRTTFLATADEIEHQRPWNAGPPPLARGAFWGMLLGTEALNILGDSATLRERFSHGRLVTLQSGGVWLEATSHPERIALETRQQLRELVDELWSFPPRTPAAE